MSEARSKSGVRTTDWPLFRARIDSIVAKQRAATSRDDVRHALRYSRLGRVVGLTGYVLALWRLNPLSPVLLAVAQMGRWGLAHQVLHRSYDRAPECPRSLRSARFARGFRRIWDWCDWIIPAAWQHEHNVHHVHTGGPKDPDVVEANVEFLRSAPYPKWRKAMVALLIMTTWRLSYYAPSTFIQLRRHERGLPPTTYTITGVFMFVGVFNPLSEEGRDFWMRCILPYGLLRFVAFPLAALPFGKAAALRILTTQLIAEVLLNFYSWALIASSHTGTDVHRFDYEPQTRGEWYAHQLLGTVNYSRGNSFAAWTQGWVNYQIEHHLCPNLTLLGVESVSRDIERVCVAHGVPYVIEPLWVRFQNMFAVVTGRGHMRWRHRDRGPLDSMLSRPERQPQRPA